MLSYGIGKYSKCSGAPIKMLVLYWGRFRINTVWTESMLWGKEGELQVSNRKDLSDTKYEKREQER